MGYKPVPKRKDVFIKPVTEQIQLSTEQLADEVVGEIVSKGSLVEHYKEGELVLFNQNKATKVNMFEGLWKVYEDYIICGLKDE